MKTVNLAMVVAVMAALCAGTVKANDDCQSCCAETACEATCGDDCGCNSCCDGCGPFARWLAADPWQMPQPCMLQRLGINIGGWVEAGITLNGQDPADRYNGTVLTNDRHGEFQLNQLWLYFERPVDTGGCGVDVGGRADLLFGTDWRVAYFHGLGFDDRINQSGLIYGLSVAQLYAEFGVNDLSIKMGRMLGVLGYEDVPPMANFFYSRSYALCYGEPILITGLMGKYKLSSELTAQAGFHQGVHRFEDNNDQVNFQGGIGWTRSDNAVSLAYALDIGKNEFLPGQGNEYIHSLVFQLQVTENTRYVLQNDLGFIEGLAGAADAEWYGINQYLFYTINERWSAGMRFEWFRDDDGARVLGLGNLANTVGWTGAPGYAGDFTELTLGLNWKPKPNIIFRPEVRWDWYNGPANANPPYPLPFDDGGSRQQFLLAADLIWMF